MLLTHHLAIYKRTSPLRATTTIARSPAANTVFHLLACHAGLMLALLGYIGKWLYKHAIVHDVRGHTRAWFVAEVSEGGANEHVQA